MDLGSFSPPNVRIYGNTTFGQEIVNMASTILRLPVRNCSCLLSGELYVGTIKVCRQASNVAVTSSGHQFPVISSQPASVQRGTGGRSSFSGRVATVFGATGTLGRAVVNQLGKCGTQVVVPYRGDFYFVRQLRLCGDLGQIHFVPFHLKDEDSLHRAMKHSDLVINLIGRDHETPNFSFEDVHVTGARNIARIARESGVKTLIHISSLNACEKPKPIILKKGSQFLASKWRGENAVREEFPDAIIFRPADSFGGLENNMLRYYGRPMRHTYRAIPLWKKGTETIKQPVFKSDIAQGILKAAFDPHAAGVLFQAVGPHRYQLGELVDWMHRVMHYEREKGYFIIDLKYDLYYWAKLLYSELVFTRHRTLSWERTEREYVTDVVDSHLPTLEDLGVQLTPLENRIFFELKRFRLNAYKDPMLEEYIRHVDPAPLAKN